MAKPSYHARTHKPGGSDPIPGQITFDADNQGGYLDITTNDVDGDALGLKIVVTTGDTWIYPAGVGQDTNGELIIWGDGGSEIGVFSGGSITVAAGSSQSIELKAGGVTRLRIDADGSIHGPTGGSITWDL